MKFKVLLKKDLKSAPKRLSANTHLGAPKEVAIVVGDGVATVMALHQSGEVSDVSDVATLDSNISSDNTAVLTVDPPTKMSFPLHGISAGTANIVGLKATWNDGSIGPFTSDPVPCTVSNKPDPITGLVVTINP